MLFTKVKAVLITLAVGALAGIAGVLIDIDWGQFGSLGPAIGLAVAAAVAYLTKEVNGYGAGVPRPPQ